MVRGEGTMRSHKRGSTHELTTQIHQLLLVQSTRDKRSTATALSPSTLLHRPTENNSQRKKTSSPLSHIEVEKPWREEFRRKRGEKHRGQVSARQGSYPPFHPHLRFIPHPQPTNVLIPIRRLVTKDTKDKT